MNPSIPSSSEVYLFHQGNLFQSYKILGAHPTCFKGKKGVRFCVWAPNAKAIGVVGDFNHWQGHENPMDRVEGSGLWVTFISDLKAGALYKYEVTSQEGMKKLKSDPYGFNSELRPNTASIVCALEGYKWRDSLWRSQRKGDGQFKRPMNIYEVHLGSWKKKKGDQFYSYREIAHELVDYVVEMGYTHIEILPLAEHPYDGSWGYQITGYYAITSRYGTPHDFMYLVDYCHQKGIGVILDWVPGHFCKDDHGLANFDGTQLYEDAENMQWGTLNFDFGRPEVLSFLISNAYFLFDVYKIDGLRVDAVASMLYLNYGKEEGEKITNKYGGEENLEAVEFMKKLNKVIHDNFPYALMIAEESSQWPLVTGEIERGGLGFGHKWNMGWMNDTLRYMETDPHFRSWDHQLINFSMMYAFSEKFILPLSHDEVVHCKKSLIEKMPGDYWRKFANLRLLFAYMMAHPGKKLFFMGSEFAQFIEWNYEQGLDWQLLDFEMHKNFQSYVKDLNHLYLKERSLWEADHHWQGFGWIEPNNSQQSIVIFMRVAEDTKESLVTIFNFTPNTYQDYRIGVPYSGQYQEIFNSDEASYGGSNQLNSKNLKTQDYKWHNQPFSINMTIPPLGAVYLKKKLVYCQQQLNRDVIIKKWG